MMLDLVQVRSFVAVAEERHFGRAAVRLNLTQSPLSRQIQTLEHRLGAALLERTTRAVRLTAAGRTFLREAYRVLEAADGAERLTRQVARGEAGLVRLGFTAASAYRALPRLVSRLREALPALDLVLDEMVTAEQREALAARRLDLGLVRPSPELDPDESGVATAVLLRERLLLACPVGHPLPEGGATVQVLHEQPLVTWHEDGGRYFLDLLGGLFREAGVRPRVVQRVNGTHTMLALVGAGLGLALVPDSARSIRMSGVALHPIALPAAIKVDLLLAWRPDSDNPALPALREAAFAAFAGER